MRSGTLRGDRANGGTHLTGKRMLAIMAIGAVIWALVGLMAFLMTRSIQWWIEVLI